MAILKHIFPFVSLAFLTGCYEDFNPNIDIEPVLCLNSLITAGEPIEVSVSHTWLYNDESASSNHSVDDAVIRVYSNDILVGSNYIPQEGDRIKIVAESERYGRAEGEVTVPVSVPIESVDWSADVTNVLYSDNNICTNINLYSKVTIKDPAESVEYYDFSFTSFPDNEETDPTVTVLHPLEFYPGTFHEEDEPIFSEHIGSFDIISGTGSYGFTFFTDWQFQGGLYSLSVRFEGANCSIRGEDLSDIPLDCGYKLILSTVSKSYYYWSSYQWNVVNGSLNDLADIGLSDPFWGYSNVSTGAGVVAAQSKSSFTINLRDFLSEYLNNIMDLRYL